MVIHVGSKSNNVKDKMSIRISYIEKLWYWYGIDIFTFFSDKDMTVSERMVGLEKMVIVFTDNEYDFGDKLIEDYVYSGQALEDITKLMYKNFGYEAKGSKKKVFKRSLAQKLLFQK